MKFKPRDRVRYMKEMGTNHFKIGIKGTVIRTSGVFISVAWDNLKQGWSFYEKTCQDKLVYFLLLAKHNPGDKCCWGMDVRELKLIKKRGKCVN